MAGLLAVPGAVWNGVCSDCSPVVLAKKPLLSCTRTNTAHYIAGPFSWRLLVDGFLKQAALVRTSVSPNSRLNHKYNFL